MFTLRFSNRLVVFSCVLWLSACAAPTSIESSWMDATFDKKPFKNIAVLALFKSPVESRQFESQAVAAFEQRGISAEEGHQFLANDKEYTHKEMEKALLNVGADGILIFKLIAVDEDESYRPPTTYVVRGPRYYGWPYYDYYYPYPFYYGYFYPAYQVTTTPGYWRETKYYVIETALYDNATDRLVWTIKSETRDPDDLQALARSVLRKVTSKLTEANLIAAVE